MSLVDAVGKSAGNIYNRTLGRLFGAGLSKGAESKIVAGGVAKWSVRSSQQDWRVKLTIPQDSSFREQFLSSKVMQPLSDHGGVVFPLTPSVIIQHQANYNPLATTHANYPFYAYQNSETSSLTIIGEFPVQNYEDAQSWIATLHFFRTVSKMFFGGDESLRGNPPPILKLNGYGEYVFKNVPVVITNFSVELTQGVDYISAGQFDKGSQTANDFLAYKNRELNDVLRRQYDAGEISYQDYEKWAADAMKTATRLATTDNLGWAPTSSIFTVQVQPVYSRKSIKNFSLQAFAAGQLNNIGSTGMGDFDTGSEGIGFI